MAKQLLELQHIDLFTDRALITFHDLISSSQLAKCYTSLPKNSLRNSWKSYPSLKALSFNRLLAKHATNLAKLRTLQFAFDHFFTSLDELKLFFKNNAPLKTLCSFDHIHVALLLNLSLSEEDHPSFPTKSTSGAFFDPKASLDLSIESASGPFLLIAYCLPKTRYLYNATDPFTHEVKNEGRGFGDLLSPTHHPLLSY